MERKTFPVSASEGSSAPSQIRKKVQKAIKENYYDIDLPYSWDLKDFEGKTIKIIKFSTSLEGFPLLYFLCEGKIYRCFLIPHYPF